MAANREATRQLLQQSWDATERRFYGGWVGISHEDEVRFGVQLYKRTGMELWFHLSENPEKDLPKGVIPHQRFKTYLHFAGNLDALKDDQIQRLCLATSWDWQRYRSELEWTDQDVTRAQELLARLESAVGVKQANRQFYEGWVGVHYGGRTAFGVEPNEENGGMEIWFLLPKSPEAGLPKGVKVTQRSEYLHFAGNLDALKDDQLRRLCLATATDGDEKSPSG